MSHIEVNRTVTEMGGKESVQLAAKMENTIAVGWNQVEGSEMIDVGIGIAVEDSGHNIIKALGSLVSNTLRQMAKGNSGKEIQLTVQLMEAIAENQAQMFPQDAMMNSTTS